MAVFSTAFFTSLSVLLLFPILITFFLFMQDFYAISSNIDEFLLISSSANMFVFGDFNVHGTQISDCDSHGPALLDLFISSDCSICSTMAFPPLENFDHVVSQFSLTFYYTWNGTLLHHIAYDYFCADWHGLCDDLRDVLLLLLLNFASGFRVELLYVTLIKNIRSSLTHLHGLQLLVLLP